jgi:hypothetical protein
VRIPLGGQINYCATFVRRIGNTQVSGVADAAENEKLQAGFFFVFFWRTNSGAVKDFFQRRLWKTDGPKLCPGGFCT